jgi:adenylate kinase family enzyme
LFMRRVVVVGTSGSGKTTVAAGIAERLGLLLIELDAIHWLPDWTELPDDYFREQVSELIQCDGWVADGNYRPVRDLLWREADTLVWLDLPFMTIFWRVIKRTVTRILTKEELWNSNYEGWDALFGADGMPRWVIKTYWRRKREYPVLLARPEYSHLDVIRLKTSAEVYAWLDNLGS